MKRNKGAKRDEWLKNGMKESRKHFKSMWNRRVRHAKNVSNGCAYKKLCDDSIYIFVL